MCRLLETICILDGIPQLLPYHQARWESAHRHFGWQLPAAPIESFLAVPPEFQQGRVKCRITYDANGFWQEWEHYQPRPIHSLQLIYADDVDYAFKYADRSALNYLWQQRDAADEILIVREGLITDTSYSNVALFDGTRYFTPAKPLLAGVRRAALLDACIVEPADIRPAELFRFQHIALINALLDLSDCVVHVNNVQR